MRWLLAGTRRIQICVNIERVRNRTFRYTIGGTDIRSVVVICLELVVVVLFPRLPRFGTPPFWPATPFVRQT